MDLVILIAPARTSSRGAARHRTRPLLRIVHAWRMVGERAPLKAGLQVLVTGHRGLVGRAVVEALEKAGLTVVGLDLADGDDVTDPDTIRQRIQGCAGVVHLAAVDDEPVHPDPLTPATTGDVDRVMATNIGGTSLLLTASAAAGVGRVVFMSSVDVLGCFMGLGPARYLPIDDNHPVNPLGPYAWSKVAGEELCAAFTRSTGTPTVCLRPPGVFIADTYRFIRSARAQRSESEWSPIWEYGAFLDARDLATAVVAALTLTDLRGHHRLLVCAADISSAAYDSLSLAKPAAPGCDGDRHGPVRSAAIRRPSRQLRGSTPARLAPGPFLAARSPQAVNPCQSPRVGKVRRQRCCQRSVLSQVS